MRIFLAHLLLFAKSFGNFILWTAGFLFLPYWLGAFVAFSLPRLRVDTNIPPALWLTGAFTLFVLSMILVALMAKIDGQRHEAKQLSQKIPSPSKTIFKWLGR